MEDFYLQNEKIFSSSFGVKPYVTLEQDIEIINILNNCQNSFEECFNHVFNNQENNNLNFDNEMENDNFFQQKTLIPNKTFIFENYNDAFIQEIKIKKNDHIIAKENEFLIEEKKKTIIENQKKCENLELNLYEKINESEYEKTKQDLNVNINECINEKTNINENEENIYEQMKKSVKENYQKKKNTKKPGYKIFKEGSSELFKMLKEAKQKKKKNRFLLFENKIEEIKNSILKKRKKKSSKKKEKFKKKRKFKPDDIRKKIKARFHKTFKNIINEKLKQAGSLLFFDFLPQSFLSNISKEKNKEVMKLTFREILEKDFTKEIKENKIHKKKVDQTKYEKNLQVLKYLDNNNEISKKSGFDIISNMIYADILKEYFNSYEFENSIYKLRNEEENEDYISEYLIKGKTYVKFFLRHKEPDIQDSSFSQTDSGNEDEEDNKDSI